MANLWNATSAGDNLTGLNNFKFGDTRTYRYMNFSNRIDWNISSAWRTSARISFFMTDQDATDYTNGMDPLKMRRTEGSQRDGINIAGDSVYTLSSTSLLTFRASYYKTVDRRVYPEMTVPESEWAQLWPNQSYSQTSRDARSCISRTSRFRAATRSAAEVLVPAAARLQLRGAVHQDAGQPLDEGRIRHSVQARGRGAVQQRRQLHVRLQQYREHRVGWQHVDRQSLGEFHARRAGPGRIDVAVRSVAVHEHRDVRSLLPGRLPHHPEPHAEPRAALQYEGGFWDPEVPAPAAASTCRPESPGCRPKSTRHSRPSPPGPRARQSGRSWRNRPGRSPPSTTAPSTSPRKETNGRPRVTLSSSCRASGRPIGSMTACPCAGATPASTRRTRPPTAGTNHGLLQSWRVQPNHERPPGPDGRSPGVPLQPVSAGADRGLRQGLGGSTNLGDAISMPQYERRPPVSDRINLSVQQELWSRVVLDVSS